MANVPIQPLDDYVVVQREEAKSKTASGLFLPDNAKEKPQAAKVVAIGKGVEGVKVGERVLYKDGYGDVTEVTIEKSDYIIVDKKNIIAIVK